MAKLAKSTPARPRRRAPSHPGEVIADVLEAKRISGRQAASAIGMSPMGLQKVLAGTVPVTPATALRIATWFGSGDDGAELFLKLQMDYDIWHERKRLQADLAKIKPID